MLVMNSMPDRRGISERNKRYLEYFNKILGHTPNIYTAMAHSDNALGVYYPFHSRRTSLSKRACEAIALVVSQHNDAMYCLSAHTMIAKLNGFSDDEIIELRRGTASFDGKLDALVKLTRYIIEHPGSVDNSVLAIFFAEGYTKEHLIDVLQVIGDSVITNITGRVFNIPIDFPRAQKL